LTTTVSEPGARTSQPAPRSISRCGSPLFRGKGEDVHSVGERLNVETQHGVARMEVAVGNMTSDIDQVWPGGMPRVGQVAERSRSVLATDIERFTEISGDRNPLHYDEAVAQASRFGEIVVQGGVTSAILNALVAEDLPGPGTVFLQVNWSFKAPVRPGDTITGRAEVLEVRADKPITRLKTSVVRDDGTLVLDGDAVCYTMPIADQVVRKVK
jgi:acyl dehydratase